MRSKHALFVVSILFVSVVVWMCIQSVHTNTAWYVDAHQTKPIFALSGADTKALAVNTRQLRDASELLAHHYPRESNFITNHFFPHTFLAQLPRLEDARRTLLHTPTRSHALAYSALLRNTQRAYIHDATELRDHLTKHARDVAYYYPSGFVEGADLIEALDTAVAHASSLLEEEERRITCLYRFSNSCERPLAKTATTKPKTPTSMAFPHNVETNAQILLDVYAPHTDTLTPDDVFIVELPDSACAPHGDPAFFLSLTYPLVFAGVGTEIEYLNTLYFNDLARNDFSTLADTLDTYDISYAYHNIASPYMCADAGTLYARITTTQEITKHLQETAIQELLESYAIPVPHIQKANDYTYVREADIAYTMHLLAQRTPTETQLQLLLNIWNERSAQAHTHVQRIAEYTHLLNETLKHVDIPHTKNLIDHTAIATLFFFANPTFTGSSEPIQLTQKTSDALSHTILTPLQKVYKNATAEHISKDVACTQRAEIALVFTDETLKERANAPLTACEL